MSDTVVSPPLKLSGDKKATLPLAFWRTMVAGRGWGGLPAAQPELSALSGCIEGFLHPTPHPQGCVTLPHLNTERDHNCVAAL